MAGDNNADATDHSGYLGVKDPEIIACMYFEDLLFLGQLQLPEVRADFLSGRIVPLYALQALLRILDEFRALIMPSWSADPCKRQAQQRSAGRHMSQVFAGCKKVVEFPSGCNNILQLSYVDLIWLLSEIASSSYWNQQKAVALAVNTRCLKSKKVLQDTSEEDASSDEDSGSSNSPRSQFPLLNTGKVRRKYRSSKASEPNPEERRTINLVSIQGVEKQVECGQRNRYSQSSDISKSSPKLCARTYPTRIFHNSRFREDKHKWRKGSQNESKSKNNRSTDFNMEDTCGGNNPEEVLPIQGCAGIFSSASRELPTGLLDASDTASLPERECKFPMVPSSHGSFKTPRKRKKRRSHLGAISLQKSQEINGVCLESTQEGNHEVDFASIDQCVSFIEESKRQSRESRRVLDSLRGLDEEFNKQLMFILSSTDHESSEDNDELSEDSSSDLKHINLSTTSMSDESDYGKNMVRRKLEDWSFES